MMPTIRLSDETFALLQSRARPFIDTPEMVIRRLLDGTPSAMESGRASVETARRPRRVHPTTASHHKGPRTIHVLVDNDVIHEGTRITLVRDRLTANTDLEVGDPIFSAHFGSRPTAQKNVIWEFDGNEYSLSELTEKIRDELDVPLAGGGLNGYWYWALESKPKVSLVDLAKRFKS